MTTAETRASAVRRGPWLRVWIIAVADWRPRRWSDVPPRAVVREVADEGLYSPQAAAAFLEAFNGQMLREPPSRWAVAVPIEVWFAGDLSAEQAISGRQCWHPGRRSAPACAASRRRD